MAGLTLDSSAVIAFERSDRALFAHLKEARLRGLTVTIPSVVVAETWRGGARSARVATLLAASVVEPLSQAVARAAGEAAGTVPGVGTIDAIVMASAAVRQDRVLTSDPGDLARIQKVFPGVRVHPV